MKPTTGRAAALAVWLVLAGGQALAVDTTADTSGQIFGSQLMTRQERDEYRAQMRAAKTARERERIRAEHHERMQERAKAQGLTLPDEPPAKGGGVGNGGGGRGSGGGRGR